MPMIRVAALTLVLVASLATVAARAASVVVPARTHLMLVPTRAFLASDIKIGHRFSLRTQDPVIAGGYVAIPEGARAQAHVVSNGPSLRIVFDWVQAPGRKIGLNSKPYEVQARGTDGKRHRFFFGLFRSKPAFVPKLAREFPLEASTAIASRVGTHVRASKALRNLAIRKYVE